MDTSTLLGIGLSVLSILVSVTLTIIGFFFASKLSKNDKTIEEIHAKIDIQNSVLLGLVQDSMKSLSMQKEVKQREDKIGESAKELEEEEQRYEALYQMQRQLNNPTSILSVGKKVGERSQHG